MPLPLKGILYETLTGHHYQGPNPDQRRGNCADFELNLVECLEAYGLKKGADLCIQYSEDFRECVHQGISSQRAKYMRYVWAKKVATGEIPWDKRRSEPVPFDSYMEGSFIP